MSTMKKGEVCHLVCKPEYAYGSAGSLPKIPPNATLFFEASVYVVARLADVWWAVCSSGRGAEFALRTRSGLFIFELGFLNCCPHTQGMCLCFLSRVSPVSLALSGISKQTKDADLEIQALVSKTDRPETVVINALKW